MQRLLNAWVRSAHSGPATLELLAAWLSLAYLLSFASGQMGLTRVSRMLAEVAPIWAWLAVFAALTIGQVVAMLRGRRRERQLMAFAGLFVWSGITGMMIITGLALGYSVPATLVSIIQFVTPALTSLVILASLSLLWQETNHAA